MDTFDSKFSTWFLPLNGRQRHQYERLENLVLQFNESLRTDVIRAKDKFNLKVRGIISDKTGLNLSFKSKELENYELDNKDKRSIPIEIVNSVPPSLLDIFDKYDDDQIDLLLHYRRMKISVKEIDYQLRNYSSFSNFHKNQFPIVELQNTLHHLQILIRLVDDSGILKAIQNIGPDILGAYFFRANKIELYWLCIGLCNILYDLPVEDFTLIVLTHELVHGYTHIGFDKDGNNWNTDDFGSADLKIIEGLAQFYTEMFCKDYFEKAFEAFHALLPEQSTEYKEYQNWFYPDERDKYEKARRILLKTRTKKIIDYEDFLSDLEKVKKDF